MIALLHRLLHPDPPRNPVYPVEAWRVAAVWNVAPADVLPLLDMVRTTLRISEAEASWWLMMLALDGDDRNPSWPANFAEVCRWLPFELAAVSTRRITMRK